MQGELLYRAATNVHEMIGSTIYSRKKSVAWTESKNPNLSQEIISSNQHSEHTTNFVFHLII